MEKLLYSITEAGELLGRRKSAAYQMAANGVLETVVVGSQRMVPARALTDLVERLREPVTSKRVERILELVDADGRIDVAAIPAGCTLADLEAAKAALASTREAV